jgi:pimeloyl-ACP methyl ester carboxylesterase
VKRTLRANGVDLCFETFGDPASPAILLVAGAAMSMDWWDEELCEQLAEGRRFVIRYDLRDTGQSVASKPGSPDYNGLDLVSDAVALLDALDVERAHVVGISMGGGIAQRLALDHPDRTASLTLMSTSRAVRDDGPELPPASSELTDYFAHPPASPDWSDRNGVVGYLVNGHRHYAGSVTIDDARLRSLAKSVVERTSGIESSSTNHFVVEPGEPSAKPLSEIAVSTLVIHGTEDPLFPLAHGEALADAIPNARLLALEGVGHEVPPPQTWDLVVPAILRHTEEA